MARHLHFTDVSDTTCEVNLDLNQQEKRFEFLENQLFLKDQKIEQLEIKYGSAIKEMSQCKIELASAKSYINSLPTHQEVTKLQKLLLDNEEKQKQLFNDLAKLKNKNHCLSDEISSLKQQVCDLKAALETTSSESETFKFTIQLWEKRRQAAKLASHLTVEDVVVEKMKLEDQFKDLCKIATCREQHLKAKIDWFKNAAEEQMRSTAADQKKIASLEIEINKLKGSLNEVALHGDQLKQSRCALENEISDLKSQLCDLQGRYNCRSKSDKYFLHCVNGISRCRKSVENIIDFFSSAVQDEDGAQLDHQDENEMKNLFQQRVTELDQLETKFEQCRKTIADLYISHLSSSISSECQIQ